MATTHPRINTVLEPAIFKIVERLARKEGVSLSKKIRDLVAEALELVEDEGWEHLVDARRKVDGKGGWLTHAEVKRRLRNS